MFKKSSSISAAKSHPHKSSLVVCTEQHPVRTGVESESVFTQVPCEIV